MNLEDMKAAVLLIGLIALIGSASAIALGDFRDDLSPLVGNSTQYNITTNGLDGIGNATSYLDTIGTIIGVAVLIGIVVLAFTFVRS